MTIQPSRYEDTAEEFASIPCVIPSDSLFVLNARIIVLLQISFIQKISIRH